jgi:uncharacterized lipoprotein YajG
MSGSLDFMIKIMEKTLIKKLLALILAGSILLSGCVSTTMIQSNPSNAKLYLNGEPVGRTPYTS